MFTSFLTATLSVGGVPTKFDLAASLSDLSKLTDEELTEQGLYAGQAYAKLLVMAKNGEVELNKPEPAPAAPEPPVTFEPSPEEQAALAAKQAEA